MGFLELGTPYQWSQHTKELILQIKTDGLRQFLHIWKINRDRHDEQLKWGEELEYSVVEIFPGLKTEARLWRRANLVVDELTVRDGISLHVPGQIKSAWHPEFGNSMVEALPDPAYDLQLNSILCIEPSMRMRRTKLQYSLPEGVWANSLACFPRMGIEDWVTPEDPPSPTSCSESIFIGDGFINPHPRFATLVRNIRHRRGAKPVITAPVFMDKKTADHPMWKDAEPLEALSRFEVERRSKTNANPIKDLIYMDMFGFGMGMGCLQVTYLCPDISCARYLYDQFLVLAPLFLALTASTPFFRGLLADSDVRWPVLEQSVDCRTEEELGHITKSRFSAASFYISERSELKDRLGELNDAPHPVNAEAVEQLISSGVDPILANHFGYLWIRDPMVIFQERVDLDNTKNSDHFENLQSTNWHSVRFKPPPASEDGVSPHPIGWRVEFRTPDLQLTDYENATITSILTVLSKIMLERQDWDMYIPISKSDENMKRSWTRDAILKQKFYFREDIQKGTKNLNVTEMTLHEIFFGCPRVGFEGLMTLAMAEVTLSVNSGIANPLVCVRFEEACDFIRGRTSGSLLTNAAYFRKFITKHRDYKGDSVISASIGRDLAALAVNVGFGMVEVPELYGQHSKFLANLKTSLPSHTSALVHESLNAPHVTVLPHDYFISLDAEVPAVTRSNENISSEDFTRCWLMAKTIPMSTPCNHTNMSSTVYPPSTVRGDEVFDEAEGGSSVPKLESVTSHHELFKLIEQASS